MKSKFSKILAITFMLAVCFTACQKDLNRLPANTVTANVAYSTPLGFKQGLAKAYSAFAVTSNTGGPTVTDVPGGDPGASDFLRLFWNVQEITTDEAKCAWSGSSNPGIQDLCQDVWDPSNAVLKGLFERSIYQITLCNDFLRQSTDGNLAAAGITGNDVTNIHYYRAEVRFLRAYQYWVLMDVFGSPSFVDETTPIGAYFPKQISRAALFSYVESELLAIDPLLVAPHKNEYGRVDEAADWALLSRLYLNAQVYTGTARYTDAMTYSQKVINATYPLMTSYQKLFLADNNVNNSEVILSINYDGVNTQTYGGTTFIINSSVNNTWSEGAGAYGVPGGGWTGNRATQNLTNLFSDTTGKTDTRAIFRVRERVCDTLLSFTSGIAVTKFRNLNSDGTTPVIPGGTFCNTDFPLFRSAEMYLTYAEAALRSGTNTAQALIYFNDVRARAYGNTTGNLGSIALSDIINERGREFYWEAQRRTDLIRFGMYTGGSYMWPFKGGPVGGASIASYRSIFPLPGTDVTANPNLVQNTGY
jgi:hypothetical protein